jgi:aspartate kinase
VTVAAKRKAELEVWKFGGASLADPAAIEKAVNLIAAQPGPLVIVASALGGVTDLLLQGAAAATSGRNAEAGRIAAEFLRRHRDVARALIPAGPARRRLMAAIDAAAREYRELCVAIGVLGHLAPRASDLLVSRGERMSASILAAALARTRRRTTEYVDAVDLISTDGHYGGAAPNLSLTFRQARQRLRPMLDAGATPVVPGFIGRAPDGSLTTLGRGGTDATAVAAAAARISLRR